MAAVNFYLKEPNADKDTPIMVMLSVDGNRFKMYTGLKTHPKQWDADKQRVRKNNSGSVELNGRLSSIEKGLPKTYYLLTEEEGITYTQVQDKLKASIQTEKPKKQRELIEVFDEFMEEKASLVKPLTMKKYKTLKNLLLNFFLI